MTSNGKRRTVVGLLPALGAAVAAVAAVGTLGATGRVTLVHDRVAGRPVVVVEGVPGPETGPVCPLDERYVDEQPEGLRPDVLDAWLRLRADAAAHGVALCLQDGKRSTGQQQREFEDAVRRFGNAELAGRYVLPPEKSMHVKGTAVDVQPLDSAAWVEHNGRASGWCRRYRNEEWHFEYHPDHAANGCPALVPSASGF